MTVDEGMIMYKEKYFAVQQYMPNKPVRFGIKIWVRTNVMSKYIRNFQVYCGKGENPHNGESSDGSASKKSQVRSGKG